MRLGRRGKEQTTREDGGRRGCARYGEKRAMLADCLTEEKSPMVYAMALDSGVTRQ